MKICITGHLGFVGRHFVSKLAGHEIVGIDIKEGNDCRDFFKTDNSYFDLIIHLAAIVGGRLTIEGNPLSVATDLAIDSDMFQWALRTKPGKVVYFSSSAAYPISKQKYPHSGLNETDIDLDNIESPDLTYGWAKLTGEYLAKFARKQGLNVYVFRPFSGYGSCQDLDYPFPSFIKRAMERQEEFEIWGDGEQTRDFIHIDDIVDGVMATLNFGLSGGTMNLCTGRETSFKELGRLITAEVGYNPIFKFLTDKPVGVKYRHGNPRVMNLFYTPKITLEEGIRRAIYDYRTE